MGMSEEGGLGEMGVKSGKSTIQSGSNPIGGEMWEACTAALCRATRRLPRGVEPPVKAVSGRA